MKALLVLFSIISPLDFTDYVPDRKLIRNDVKVLSLIGNVTELGGPAARWCLSFRGEIKWLRRNWLEAKEYPPLSEGWLLPDPYVVHQYCKFNRSFATYLEFVKAERKELEETACEIARENERLYWFWMAVSCAIDENQTWVFRRKYLREAETIIGREVMLTGRFPPPVPLWRYRTR